MWNDSGRSSWGPLKGDIARAEADTRRSAELDAQIARQKAAGKEEWGTCAECGGEARPQTRTKICDRCKKRLHMRAVREAARARLAARGIDL